MMTVEELIKRLQACDPKLVVHMDDTEYGPCEFNTVLTQEYTETIMEHGSPWSTTSTIVLLS